MSYNWCHGPNCHTNHTQSRIRGSGDNKVLRTRRIKYSHWNSQDRYNDNGSYREPYQSTRTTIKSVDND